MRLPAEWEPQWGVMLTWPHAATDWADNLAAAEQCFTAIATAVSRHEHLLVVVQDDGHRGHVVQQLQAAGADMCRVLTAPAVADDTWARDHGPLTTLADDGTVVVNDFHFNAWGGKFAFEHDDAIVGRLHAHGLFARAAYARHALVLEGGALETDGQGSLLATRRSIINPNRNPGLDQAAIERVLNTTLGFDRFLWLDNGELTGDDTDSHIDILARFTPTGDLLHQAADPGSPDHAALAAMADELRGLRDRDGRGYPLIALPDAGELRGSDGRRLSASYANFLVIDGAVLAPVYGMPADQAALDILARTHPGREIIPVDCRALIEQNGSLHCVTMQLPQGIGIARP